MTAIIGQLLESQNLRLVAIGQQLNRLQTDLDKLDTRLNRIEHLLERRTPVIDDEKLRELHQLQQSEFLRTLLKPHTEPADTEPEDA